MLIYDLVQQARVNTISFNLSLRNYNVKPYLKRKGKPQYLVSTLFIAELVIY
jgi:hypothetical protein